MLLERNILFYLFVILFYGNFSNANDSQINISTVNDLEKYVLSKLDEKSINSLKRNVLNYEVRSNQLDASKSYLKIQKRISELIPEEFERPIIDLKIYFGNGNIERKRVGILGGIGPLSDASILNEVITDLSNKNSNRSFLIHMYSNAPPRTYWEMLKSGIWYTSSIMSFFSHDYGQFYLASNTAYLKENAIKLLNPGVNLVNLPKKIARKIKSESVGEKILILGTSAAWENNLYDLLLSELNLGFTKLNGHEQAQIQDWINRVKKNRSNSIDSKKMLKYIKNLASKYNTNSILLGCTEIPWGLGGNIEELLLVGYKVYNSEKLFAEFIVDDIVNTP